MKQLSFLMSVACLIAALTCYLAAATVLFVSPQGDDGNAGTTQAPYATLSRARDELRRHKPDEGAVVEVAGGDYLLPEPFELTAADAAPEGKRIEYQARPGETVRLFGGTEITGFRPFKGSVLQADVSALKLNEIPPISYGRYSGNAPGFEIFFQGKRLPLARWPNQVPGDARWGEWSRIPRTTEKTKLWFHYSDERISAWKRPTDAQIHWFPWYNYMDQYVGIKSIDTTAKVIHLASPASYHVQPGRRFYVRNVFEELDAPGEWFLDREKSILYLWPPAPLNEGIVVASRLATIVHMNGTSRTTIRGFTIESCRGDAVVVEGGSDNQLVSCVVRNALQDGVSIRSGSRNGVLSSDIHNVGRRGVLLGGGVRESLTPAGNYVRNCHIHHMSKLLHTYAPGIQITGCGNLVQHNLIHDGPHMIMGLAGNDHLIEYNHMHHAMIITSHGGAFYCGRDFTARGNVIRYNMLHDVSGYGIDRVDKQRGVFIYSSPVRSLPGAFGIHLDDQISGFHIHGNIFYRLAHGVIRAGGGRDIVIENNIFVDTGWAVHLDSRGMGWQKKSLRNGTLMKRLKAMPYTNPPWSERYPELVDVTNDRFGEPVDNVVRRNIFLQKELLYNFTRVPSDRFTVDYNLIWRGGEDIRVTGKTYSPTAGGVVSLTEWRKLGFDTRSVVADPQFIAPAKDDFRLRPESPAWGLGFQPIPVDKIGLYADKSRPEPLPSMDRRRMTNERVIEEYPIPDFVPAEQRNVEIRALQTNAEITVDGVLHGAEWAGLDPKRALTMTEDYRGNPVTYKSRAWVTHDGRNLCVAVRNAVNPKRPLTATTRWGRDDAVELALQSVSDGAPTPIIVLRGYPNGHHDICKDPGTPLAIMGRVREAAAFAAGTPDRGTWEAEWVIPLEALGIPYPQPAREPQIRLNVTTRKAASNEWVMWVATHGNSWRVENAGVVILGLPGGG